MSLTVAQLLPDLNVGGVERGTVEIADALVRAGHRAIVVSRHGRLVEQLQTIGAEHIPLAIGHKSLMTLGLIGKLKQVLLDRQVDIVHARSRLPAWIGHLALKGIPLARRPHWVTTVHGPYTVNRYSRIMTSGERVIAISEFIRAYVEENYPDVRQDRITVIHRGVDRDVFNPSFKPSHQWLGEWRQTLPVSDDVKLLLFPGRLTRWKGQLTFIEVLRRLADKGLRVHGLVAGGQSDAKSNFEAELKHAVAHSGISDKVTFLGERNDLKELFSIADMSFSLTTEPEAFGRTTLEALSLGTPVIGYEHGGTGEILRHIFPEGLVTTGDIDKVVAKVESFLVSPPSVVESHSMTLANMQAQTIRLYESLV